MNPAVYGSLPEDACALGATGAYGPDRITKNIYNAAGEITQMIQGYGTADQRAYATFSYSDNGLPTDWIDGNGNRTHLAYDGFDRLDTLYFPSTSRAAAFNPATPESALATAGAYSSSDYEKYEYYDGGNRMTWRRRDGAVISFGYDGLNRETLKDLPGGTTQDVHTGYDLLGNIVFRRFGSTTGPGVSYTHDIMGRVKSTTDMNGRTIGYSYNQASGRTRLTYADGIYIGYALDYANRMTHFGWNTSSGLYTQSYDKLGRLETMTKGSATTGFKYHPAGYLASVTHDFAGSANDIAWSFPTYNPASQIINLTSSSDTYDYVEASLATTSKTYDGLNRDAGIAALSGGYDPRGNLTHDKTRTFTYDIENKLLTATGGTANLTLTYDPEGRISKYRSGSSEVTFLYDGPDLIAEYDGNGALSHRYVHGSATDDPVLWLEGSGTGAGHYLYTNHQGSVIAHADAAGNREAMYKYDAYGQPKDANNQDAWTGIRFRYTGQLMLPEAKLYHYKARVYDPGLGRFLQTDPIGAKDDLNMYAYVKNDPVNKTDPTGLSCTGATPTDAVCVIDYFNGVKVAQARKDGKISNRMETKIRRFETNATAAYKKALEYGSKTVKVKAFANASQRTFSGNQIAEKMRDTKVNIETRTGISATTDHDYQAGGHAGAYAGAHIINSQSREEYHQSVISVLSATMNAPQTAAWDRYQSEAALHEPIHMLPGMGSNDRIHQQSFHNAINQILGQ